MDNDARWVVRDNMNKFMNTITCGDCIDLMREIPPRSVDAIIIDLPYGVTRNNWDTQIPFGDLWREWSRIRKPATPIILFAQGMFTSELILSNPRLWKYNLVWVKSTVTGFLNANRQPLRNHEDIVVFYEKQPTYNPQKQPGPRNHSRGNSNRTNNNYGIITDMNIPVAEDGLKFPTSTLFFDTVPPSKKIHPTEKPVPLLEYLVKTYSNQNDIILDTCCGCGSTLVACKNTGRNFIGFDINPDYCTIATNRLTIV